MTGRMVYKIFFLRYNIVCGLHSTIKPLKTLRKNFENLTTFSKKKPRCFQRCFHCTVAFRITYRL